MKFPIRRKIFFLTAILSLAFIVVSVSVSSIIFSIRSKANVMSLCQSSAERIATEMEDEHGDFIQKYKEKMVERYNKNYEDIEHYSDMPVDDESFNEIKEYFDDLVADWFPPKTGFGMSYEMLEFKNNYEDTLRKLDLVASSEGMMGGFICLYDSERNNFVYMVDSTSNVSYHYNFPCSIERVRNPELVDAMDAGIPKTLAGREDIFCVFPIKDKEGNVMAYVGFQYSMVNLESTQSSFILTLVAIMIVATIAMVIVYLLFSDKFLVKNIQKLSDTAIEFSSKLERNEKPEVLSPDIKTKDEIGALSNNFVMLQNRMLDYINDIETKTAQEERMQAELSIASKIQLESLPTKPLVGDKFRIRSFIRPAKEVGGDLFDYFMLDENRLFFVIADVSGKSVPAALFMMRGNELIRSCAKRGMSTEEIAEYVNNELCRNNKEGLFISSFIGIYDLNTNVLKFTRAGHEQPFILRNGVADKISEESNFVLGALPNFRFTEDSIVLEEGDKILLYTDGLNEGINSSNEEFDYDRIKEGLEKGSSDILASLFSSLSSFTEGMEQFDDVTMMLLEIGKFGRIELKNPKYEDIPVVTDKVFSIIEGADGDKKSEMGVILDELINNYISYAFTDVSKPELVMDISISGDDMIMTFTDNGKLFNPLTSEAADVDVDISERKMGGLGIMMVREFTQKMEYDVIDGKNRLTIYKTLR